MVEYSSLIDKIADNINKWSAKSLSYAGRIELIKSILQRIECYWLQIFPLPVKYTNRITALCRNFLWRSKATPVAWKDVCLPKEEGGLGLREIRTGNKALMVKILWKIHEKKDSLWIKWIHTEYLKNRDLWRWKPHTRDSPLIKNLERVGNEIVEKNGGNVREAQGTIERWFKHGKGTCAAYHWLRRKLERKCWQTFIWKSFVPQKYSFFLWLALRGRLATKDRLTYLGIDSSRSGVACH
ncbi:hypothetical protein C2S51_007023 [Perilla frutescens var. frutescens]|nr:hypothetical protein C2S51_007023 [Perilla frutescens var. frutescens]